SMSINDAQIQKYFGSSSYYSFNQKYYIQFLQGVGAIPAGNEVLTRWAAGLNNQLLQVFGSVKYAFFKNYIAEYPSWLWDLSGELGDVRFLKNKYFLPLGLGYDAFVLKSDFSKLDLSAKDRVLLKAIVIDDSEQDRYKELHHFDPATMSENFPIPEFAQDIALLQASAMQMDEHHQNLIRGTVNLEARKVVFFSIPYDKGWSAIVDQKPAEL